MEEHSMETGTLTQHGTPILARIRRYLALFGIALALAVGSTLPASGAPVTPQSCAAMLQPTFAWANKGLENVYPTEVVYATVAVQSPQDLVRYVSSETGNVGQDQLYFATGIIRPVTLNGQTVLQGSLNLYHNKVATLGTAQPLVDMGQATYVLTMQANGIVKLQPQVSGKNFLGRGPTVFQGTCANGLIVGLQQAALFNSGTHSLTVGFTNTTNDPVIVK
jgi:hypothetical protein